MIRTTFTRFVIFAALIVGYVSVNAQEFPVAVGADTTFSLGAVYGGLNGIVAVQGDNNSPHNINAQLVAAGGVLIGPRISLGASGIMPGATPIFDGTNYFLIWREFNGNLKGQFLNTSGELIGGSITIATNVSIERPGTHGIALADTVFLVVFTKTDNILYGQIVGKSGSLIGGQVRISNNYAREVSLAYDNNSNFLVTWVEIIPDKDKDIFGQFVSKSSSLIGNNFLIDGGPYYSDNPTSLAFDGTRYLLVFHEQPLVSNSWFILGRFITTSGVVEETITICDSTFSPSFPSVAFDNENYFITWTQFTDMSLHGRFYNKSGVPIDASFVVMNSSGNKIPIGGVGFGGGLYLVVATKVNSNFSDGDVYARFISPLPTGVDNEINLMPDKIALYQNYPNPFNPSTTIMYQIPEDGVVTLRIYDVLGREVKTLVNGFKTKGRYEVIYDAGSLTSEIYIYEIVSGNYKASKKMTLIK